MRLRPARRDDLPAIAALWRALWEAHRAADPRLEANPLGERVMTAWMEELLGSDRFRITVADDGGVVGYASAQLRENPPVLPDQVTGVLLEISVADSRRGRGIGSLLLEDAHAWFRSKGVRHVEAEIAALNPRARSFWERHGYRPFVERRRLDL